MNLLFGKIPPKLENGVILLFTFLVQAEEKSSLVTQNEKWIVLSPILESKGNTIDNYSRIGIVSGELEGMLTQLISQTLISLQAFLISALNYQKPFSLINY